VEGVETIDTFPAVSERVKIVVISQRPAVFIVSHRLPLIPSSASFKMGDKVGVERWVELVEPAWTEPDDRPRGRGA
jgi:hypothetical protein